MEQEQLDMAYAAGALDGDGSFFITRRESPSCIRYVAGANIGKSCKDLIDFFMDKFSGNIDQRGNHYRWNLNSSIRMIPFLESITPFLTTKKEQALCLLNWLKEDMPNKEDVYLQMKILNQSKEKNIITPEHLWVNHLIDESPLKWAYIAGLMDTDGSFMIHKRENHNGMKSPNYISKISYGENDSRPINFIRHIFPFGNVNLKDSSTAKGGRFVWELVVKLEIVDFIERLLPYLKVKKINAEIVLDFCKKHNPVKRGHRFGVPLEELAFRENCFQDLQKYQRR